MSDTETRYYHAPGGQLLTLDWPPHEAILAQITRGELQRCTAEGAPYVEPTEDGEPAELKPPGARASKDEWVGYVVALTADTEHAVTVDEAQAMTVQDMRERYGSQ
jgi:hypothetical protein